MNPSHNILPAAKASEPILENTGPGSTSKFQFVTFTLCLILANERLYAKGVSETVTPYVASNFLYDSNFFRVSDSTDLSTATGQAGKSEFLKQIATGLRLDWKINRQQLLAEANLNQNWFQNFSSLDYLGWSASSQWNWHFGSHLDGEIGFNKKVFLGDYNQLNRFVANLQENQQFFANAGYLFHARGLLKLGITRKERQYDDVIRQISNSIEDNAELDIQYISPDNSTIGVHGVLTEGRFPNRTYQADSTLDDGYKRFNTGVVWDWHYSAITHIDGMVGYLYQRYNHLSERNFGDAIANLAIHWQTTDKTLIDLLAKREIRQANNLNASFSLLQGVELKTQVEISPKLKLSVPMNYLNQQFLGDIAGENSGQTAERNNLYGLGLRLIYHPIDNISINAMLNFEKRDSNYASRAYQDHAAGLSVQAVF
ncbi:outer membrane beta-barrel protein [Methylomonas methanica]|uniref:Exopolysaccharide biosynthesis operon protein EpsL n=1 Tax=Methylomonas methanica (strain DSM 25384 / MC09) TaxID=857087 RepID=G0A3H7_METMM|nr:outer membrane beta-barrel protein [Methylomonas methanica]AEG00276.1 hypothetical protein Metme_1860 [Methylomonas methanica MC09]